MQRFLKLCTVLIIVLLAVLGARCATRYKTATVDSDDHYMLADMELGEMSAGNAVMGGAGGAPVPQMAPRAREADLGIQSGGDLDETPWDPNSTQPMANSGSFADWLNPAAHAEEQAAERYLIRTGSLTLEIKDYEAAKNAVEQVAEQAQGFIADTRMDKYGDGTRTGSITLRIPNDGFFETFKALKEIGDVSFEETSSQDVSGEYVSSVSQMQNLVHEQEVLADMLDDARAVLRSRGLGEAYDILLKTEERLSDVTGELLRVEDRVKYLSDQISLSTITVNLSERPVYQADEWSWGFGTTFDGAKKDLAFVLRAISQGFIRFLVLGWLWFIPVLIVLWILRHQWKKHITPRLKASGSARKAKAPSPPAPPS